MGKLKHGTQKRKIQKSEIQKNEMLKSKTLNGVITVEMSYLIPIILMVFLLTIYSVFYYHDKNILIGAASETAVLGAQMERKPDEKGQTDLETFFQERIQGKLILFSGAQVDVSTSSDQVNVLVLAEKGRMKIRTEQKASVVVPEEKIRRKKILEKLAEQEE